ncbi:thiamine pyrophosphate-dependent dehydrogenase E1 component subunit alpha [Nocardiopsis sp. MG754419]|uniref:thiamine pyrophosphate-dependent dehydrogenase E1 component subunit alpha n=1 Tax=Nocardiopsis sp. MG754419 TaxID=2259865 RepID=UPI001BA5C872|nr:thiamine pyrophosphate-dependent enzyme [Nocardiopsis sp. MG754419]MBR8742830.1 pyruvate dehydrogenase [Nocardiopsis sp. MG754419]
MHPQESTGQGAITVEHLSPELTRGLYRDMRTARDLDTEAIALQRQGVFPAYVSVRGQEAAQVGGAAALDPTRDFVFPTYREMAAALAYGVEMVGYMASHRALWHGGLYDVMDSRFGAINAVVGGPVPHAVGWAVGERLRDGDGVAMAYFGDGASSEGDVHEAMNFAGVFTAPVIFFCQNNQWALSVPNHRQVAGGSIAARAQGYGIEGVLVDGNDVGAVHTATAAAVRRAREGGGPTVIEALTYRVEPHSTSDDPGRYRDEAEADLWRERDPLVLLRAAMIEAGHADEAHLDRVDAEAAARAEEIRDGVAGAPEPDGSELFTHVFRETTEELTRQHRTWQEEVEL